MLLGPAEAAGAALSRPSFSPDGRRIAAMTRSHLSEANTTMVKMWDTATGHEMMTLTGPGDRAGTGMASVAFTEDGHRLILLAPDASVRALPASRPKLACRSRSGTRPHGLSPPGYQMNLQQGGEGWLPGGLFHRMSRSKADPSYLGARLA